MAQDNAVKFFQLSVARAIAAQLILAVSFITLKEWFTVVSNQELIPKTNL
jgi:hypothetical protein